MRGRSIPRPRRGRGLLGPDAVRPEAERRREDPAEAVDEAGAIGPRMVRPADEGPRRVEVQVARGLVPDQVGREGLLLRARVEVADAQEGRVVLRQVLELAAEE